VGISRRVSCLNQDALFLMVYRRTQVLTCKELMPFDKMTRSKMAMLRIANFLLRRLSASHHTVLCGKVMMFLAYSFPLYERSGVNLLGAFNEDNVTQVEDEEEFLQLIQADHSNPGKNTIDYTLYSRFWELQQFFVVKAEKGCLMDLENWEKFVHVANVVLQAFESNPFSKADLDREMVNHRKRSRSRSLSSIEIDSNTPSFVPTKFLSSSRLLSLQLSDPVLRRNVLCQFMILFHTISKSPLKTVSEKAREKDKSFGVQYLVKRVAELIKHTPPDGDSFFKDMGSILESESGWKTWKSNKCPNFERYPIHEEKMDGPPSKVPKPSSNIELWSNDFADWRNSFASRAANTTPVFPDFIKDMEIAMDPENCIEEDYHPKYDDVYCWRGFRLLSRDNLEVMEKVVDGSLEHACSSRVPSYKSENADKTDIVMADGTLDEPATKVSPS